MLFASASSSLRRFAVFFTTLCLTGCLSSSRDPKLGAKGVATFADDDGKLLPIAVGATTKIGVATPVVVGRVESSDPALLAVRNLEAGGISDIDANAVYASFDAAGAAAGAVTVTLYDQQNVEIDHATIVVEPVASLALNVDTSRPLTVVTGSHVEILATTLDARGQTLAGRGAVLFGYEGAAQEETGDQIGCQGGCGFVDVASEGEGRVQVTAGAATASVTLAAVAPSAVDSLTFSQPTVDFSTTDPSQRNTTITYSLFAHGQLVHGQAVKCMSDDPNIVTAEIYDPTLPLNGETTGTLFVSASQPGNVQVRCSFGSATAAFTGIGPRTVPTKW